MVADMDWVNAVLTSALLGVTTWYAITTRAMTKANERMAETARDATDESARATEAARLAADAAREAAAVAQSQIRPEFTADYMPVATGHKSAMGLKITSTGDPVVVQKIWIRRAFRRSTYEAMGAAPDLVSVCLSPLGDDSTLPRRVHRGEVIVANHPEFEIRGDDPFETFILDVEYTFVEDGRSGGKREVSVHPPQVF